jgi:NADPH:quinone reductase-like Zn-dependent oxidoreductase
MKQLLMWFENGKLKPRIGHVYPFAQARQALADILARQTVGKAVVQIG